MTGPLVSQAWNYFCPQLYSRDQPLQAPDHMPFPILSFPLLSNIFLLIWGVSNLPPCQMRCSLIFQKTELPLKAFSGQCAQSESQDNKAAMPSVAGKEGTSIFTRTFVHALIHACLRWSVHAFIHVCIHSLDFQLAVCWGLPSAQGHKDENILSYLGVQCLPEEADAQPGAAAAVVEGAHRCGRAVYHTGSPGEMLGCSQRFGNWADVILIGG